MSRTVLDLAAGPWDALEPRWIVLGAVLVSISIAGAFLASLLRRTGAAQVDLLDFLSVIPAGGVLVLTCLALSLFLLGASGREPHNHRAVILALTAALVVGAWLQHRGAPGLHLGPLPAPAALAILSFGLLFLRLTFIRDLALPPYSDSVEHYQIINDLLHPERPPQAFYNVGRLTDRYYHFGFHALAAWASALSGAPVQESMLVLGQILQTVIPVSFFFVVRRATGSDAAGLFGVLLAGLAWRMPGFASNWGKYPALTSLAALPLVFGLFLLADSASDRKTRLTLWALALTAGALAGLSHTRSLLLLGMGIAGWWTAGRLLQSRPVWQTFAFIAVLAGTAWIAHQAARSSELALMLSPYLRAGLYSTLLVVLLVALGLRSHPRPALAALLFLVLLLGAALVPLPDALARYGYQTLVDRPFAQMTLFLPLTLAGAIGYAGLAARRSSTRLLRALKASALLLVPLALTLTALRFYDYSPSTCCQLAGRDDLAAFEWIEGNLPHEAVILIAANRTPARSYGVDGGIWITPLTGYRTEKWPHNALMDSPAILEGICAKGATHIYAGGVAARFSVERIESHPAWYARRFARPGAAVYEIVGCAAEAD